MSLLSAQLRQLMQVRSLPEQIIDALHGAGKPLSSCQILHRVPDLLSRERMAAELSRLCGDGRITSARKQRGKPIVVYMLPEWRSARKMPINQGKEKK